MTFPDLSATSGFGGTGGTSTNSGNSDPYAVDSSAYTFTSGATTPPGPANVNSVDLRGNSGNDALTFTLDNTRPDRRLAHRHAVRRERLRDTTSLTVNHLAYTADIGGSGVASSTLTVASAGLTNGTCGSFGAETPAVDGAFTATDGTCYRFTLTGTDLVGNAATTTQTVKVDTTAPSQPAVAFTASRAGTRSTTARARSTTARPPAAPSR